MSRGTRRGGRRVAAIAAVLARHGAASAVGHAVLKDHGWSLPLRRRLRGRVLAPAVHLRLALQELGTTFVKLGQVLSTRGDLLPADYQAELARLQDAEPPEPVAAIRQVVESELGQPVDALYASFDAESLAAASIGQAHAAVTLDGLEVVVKVRRPGVVDQVEADLALLERMARHVTRWTRFGRRHDVKGLTREFAATLRAELDYIQEAGNAERFEAAFADDVRVRIPKVMWPLTTHQVLTLERLRGVKVTDFPALEEAHLDRSELARRAASIEMKMIFEDGFFHADPHPGNFFIEPGGRIGLIDFGMTGVVDTRTRQGLVKAMASLVARDGDGLLEAVESLGIAGGDVRAEVGRDGLRADLMALAESYLDQPLGDLSLATMLRDLLTVVRRHHLHLPPNLALLVKTLGMAEGIAAQLDPSFRIVSVMLPFAQVLAPPAAAAAS